MGTGHRGRHGTRAGRHRRGDAARSGASRSPGEAVPGSPGGARRRLPAPSLPSLLGIAVLVLIGLGAVHLSGQGTAVPTSAESTVAATTPEAGAEVATGADGSAGTAGTTPTAEDAAPAEAATTAVPSGDVVVHVSGAVAEPGVVTLPAGSRVDDAVQAAGGATEDAELASVNLARTLVDGEQIHVPVPGEEPTVAVPTPSAEGTTGEATAPEGDAPAGESLIDLNTADAATLEELPGVGPAIAARIIEYRDANGPFTSVDELEEVPGIGPVTLEEIRPRATV